MEVEERLLFEELELEEPSSRVDEEILGFARTRLHARTRRAVVAHGVLGAALVLALFLLIPRDGGSPQRTEQGPEAAAITNPLDDIQTLREEVQQIEEMADLIPESRRDERETIEEKIRLCLSNLKDIEDRILGIRENSYLYEPSRKEANI